MKTDRDCRDRVVYTWQTPNSWKHYREKNRVFNISNSYFQGPLHFYINQHALAVGIVSGRLLSVALRLHRLSCHNCSKHAVATNNFWVTFQDCLNMRNSTCTYCS
ncbi:hypothetical protein ACOSQ3_026368 [Xanthoceras sorbifolium]